MGREPHPALAVTARCLRRGCEWTAAGSWEAADKAAEKHSTKAEHPTVVTVKPGKQG